MINVTGATIARVKTMADGSIRIELDLGELCTLADLDDLLRTSLTVVIAPEGIVPRGTSQTNDESNSNREEKQ